MKSAGLWATVLRLCQAGITGAGQDEITGGSSMCLVIFLRVNYSLNFLVWLAFSHGPSGCLGRYCNQVCGIRLTSTRLFAAPTRFHS